MRRLAAAIALMLCVFALSPLVSFADTSASPAAQPGQADDSPPPADDSGQQSDTLPPARPVTPVASTNGVAKFGVAESFRNEQAAKDLGLSWDRIIMSWSDIQPGGPNDWRADLYFSPQTLQRVLDRGIDVVGVIQFTPGWAARNDAEAKRDGQRAVPRGLDKPFDSPENTFGQFARRLAEHYKGRINTWIIWNEVEFRPGDTGAGQSNTLGGCNNNVCSAADNEQYEKDYLNLLKTGYRAIKAGNPNARVGFSATSYWVDIGMRRQAFFTRLLDRIARDPDAANNNFFFDVAPFNVYRAPDDLLRIFLEMLAAMKAKGIDKPIWLTETNAMPYDDPATPKPSDGQRVTLSQQGDYVAQALAIASAIGYQRVGWYRITDGGVWQDQEVWGLMRDDGYPRPAYQAFKTVVGQFAGASRVTFLPLEREQQPFGTPWPQDPNSYYPNWAVYQVVFDHSDGRRVTVLWNATDDPLKVRIPKQGTSAKLIEKLGLDVRDLNDTSGFYVVNLPSSNVHGPADPQGYHYVGGQTFLVVQNGVPADAPIQEPRLGETPETPGVVLSLDPAAAKFSPGQGVQFTLRLRGIEGFNSPVQLSTVNLPAGAIVEMPPYAYPGDRVTVTLYTDPSMKPGLYVDEVFIQASGGGVTSQVALNMEVVP